MHELLTQFGIDWRLLLAQALNFFILLFLLKRYAYGPVIKMLNERRRKIIEGLAASEASQKKLAEAEDMKRAVLIEADKKALSMISEAEKEAILRAETIIESAHTKSDQVMASGQKRLEEEHSLLEEEFQAHAEGLLKTSLRKIIGSLEPEERDSQLIAEALNELHVISKKA